MPPPGRHRRPGLTTTVEARRRQPHARAGRGRTVQSPTRLRARPERRGFVAHVVTDRAAFRSRKVFRDSLPATEYGSARDSSPIGPRSAYYTVCDNAGLQPPGSPCARSRRYFCSSSSRAYPHTQEAQRPSLQPITRPRVRRKQAPGRGRGTAHLNQLRPGRPGPCDLGFATDTHPSSLWRAASRTRCSLGRRPHVSPSLLAFPGFLSRGSLGSHRRRAHPHPEQGNCLFATGATDDAHWAWTVAG